MNRLIQLFLADSFLLIALTLYSRTAIGQEAIASVPLQQYGLGTLGAAAISPDGKRVLTGGGNSGYLWNAETATVIRSCPGDIGAVAAVAFSPDNLLFATGGADAFLTGYARIWDAATGVQKCSISVPGNSTRVQSVAFSPDGRRLLTAGGDPTASPPGDVRLWDAETGEQILLFLGHTDEVFSGAFSLDGSVVVTASQDYTVRLWDASTGAELRRFTHSSPAYGAALSPDMTQLITTDGVPRLWNVQTGEVIREFSGHLGNVLCVAFSPDGSKVLTGGQDSSARLWEAGTGALLQTFSGHAEDIWTVAFSADGTKVLTRSWDNTARTWDAGSGNVLQTYSGHTETARALAFSPDGSDLLSVAGQHTGWQPELVTRWDVATGQAVERSPIGDEGLRALAISPDRTKLLQANSNGGAILRKLSTGQTLAAFSGHTQFIACGAFSPDGTKVVTGANIPDQTARIWDAATGNALRALWHPWFVYAVAFSPDGTKVLTGSSREPPDNRGLARLWDVATGDILTTFSGQTREVKSVAFSPDGKKVLTGSYDRTAKLWDAATGDLIHNFPVIDWYSVFFSLAYSPDGTRVATGDSSGYAQIWDPETGVEIVRLRASSQGIYRIDFSPDSTKVVTACGDGTTFLWELNPPRAIVVAGGGEFLGNGIAEQTGDLGAYAFKTLKRRGYLGENIKYLTAFGPSDPENPAIPFRDADGDGLNDVDGWSTLENLHEAITGAFGSGAGRLLIMMIDHGYRTQDFMAFRLNPTQSLPSTTLDGWLDDLQTSSSTEVTLVVDSCYSGQIAEDCRLTPEEMLGGF